MEPKEEIGTEKSWPDRYRRGLLYGLAIPVVAALLFLPRVLQGEPDISTLLSGAKMLALVGAHDEAITDCGRVLERDPDNVQAHLILAMAQDARGRHSEAIAVYQDVLDGELSSEQELSVRLAIADSLLRGGRFHASIDSCNEILSFFPTSHEALLVRGLAEERLSMFHEARESLRQAHRLDPDDARVDTVLTRLLEQEAVFAP